jgi:hypothetical protein
MAQVPAPIGVPGSNLLSTHVPASRRHGVYVDASKNTAIE